MTSVALAFGAIGMQMENVIFKDVKLILFIRNIHVVLSRLDEYFCL